MDQDRNSPGEHLADWWYEQNQIAQERQFLRDLAGLSHKDQRKVLHVVKFLAWRRAWREHALRVPDRVILHGAALHTQYRLTRWLRDGGRSN